MARKLYWLGVVSGVVLLVAGVVVGGLGYAATADPARIVRDYFAALARGDAARALAYGTVPDGPRTLLTGVALREQQRIAPLRGLQVLATHRHKSTAVVDVRYSLAFDKQTVPVKVSVPLHKSSGDWWLDAVAVRTELLAGGAAERQSILGARVPAGPVLLFPGALPIRFDSNYLELDPFEDYVSFDTLSTTAVYIGLSDAGRTAVRGALRAEVKRCLTSAASPGCPLPNERYVPGSFDATISGDIRVSEIAVDSAKPAGVVRVSGTVTVSGTWKRLDFHNRQRRERGSIDLDLRAIGFAVAPMRLRWAPA